MLGFFKNQRGASTPEYVLLLAMTGLSSLVGIHTASASLLDRFDQASLAIAGQPTLRACGGGSNSTCGGPNTNAKGSTGTQSPFQLID